MEIYIYIYIKNITVSHSIRLFCRGVPVRTILLLVLMEFIAFDTADASFFRMWPSSQITKSGPERNIWKKSLTVWACNMSNNKIIFYRGIESHLDMNISLNFAKMNHLKIVSTSSWTFRGFTHNCTWFNQCFLKDLFELLALDVPALRQISVHLVANDHNATHLVPSLESVCSLLWPLYCGQLSHLFNTTKINTLRV